MLFFPLESSSPDAVVEFLMQQGGESLYCQLKIFEQINRLQFRLCDKILLVSRLEKGIPQEKRDYRKARVEL